MKTTNVRLPLVECAHPAAGAAESTPDRVAALLAAEEANTAGSLNEAPEDLDPR